MGVHTLPTVFDPQAAFVPSPGVILVRSKMTGPPGTVKVMNAGTLTVPVNAAPVRFWIVPPVRPAKPPVLGLLALKKLGVIPLSAKNTPPELTVTVPLKLAWPVAMVVAEAVEMERSAPTIPAVSESEFMNDFLVFK